MPIHAEKSYGKRSLLTSASNTETPSSLATSSPHHVLVIPLQSPCSISTCGQAPQTTKTKLQRRAVRTIVQPALPTRNCDTSPLLSTTLFLFLSCSKAHRFNPIIPLTLSPIPLFISPLYSDTPSPYASFPKPSSISRLSPFPALHPPNAALHPRHDIRIEN